MMGLLIALISGALMSIQGVFNTQVTKASGVWSASAFVQFLALIVCLGVWACVERSPLLNVFRVEPKYMLLGGAIGALITYTVIRSMASLGPARAAMLVALYKAKLRLSSQTISVNNPFNSTNMTNMVASKPLIDQEEYFLYVRQIGLHCTTDGYVSHTLSLSVLQGYPHSRSKPPFRYMLSNILVGLVT